jgi:hypothetical protein
MEVKPRKSAKTLLISAKENEGILNNVLKELEQEPPRVQSGANWSLRRFIDCDLKNYMAQKFIVLDILSFQEFNRNNEDFIALLHELQEKHMRARIILYCAGLQPGNYFLHQLVQSGFTNIIADYPALPEDKNFELIFGDLKESLKTGLSEQKYSRFVIPEPVESDCGEAENCAPDFSDETRIVTVFGTQRRIGVTTFAMSLCRYVAAHGGTSALVLCCSDSGKELELMSEFFSAEIDNGKITMNNINVYTRETATDISGYNLVVYDCGDVKRNADKLDDFKNSDMIFLCCGIGWKELYLVTTANTYMSSSTYTAVVNAELDSCKLHRDVLCANYNSCAAVDFRDCVAVGQLVFGG